MQKGTGYYLRSSQSELGRPVVNAKVIEFTSSLIRPVERHTGRLIQLTIDFYANDEMKGISL